MDDDTKNSSRLNKRRANLHLNHHMNSKSLSSLSFSLLDLPTPLSLRFPGGKPLGSGGRVAVLV